VENQSDSRELAAGVLYGALGMLGFSGTLAATRVALADFSPLSVTCARIVIAAALSAVTLIVLKQHRLPRRKLLPSILWMGLGLAVGFPFFVALALVSVPAVHGAVALGLAPAATAIIAAVRLGERHDSRFWIACAIGFIGVFYYAWDAGGGKLLLADLWLLLALLCVGSAYVEGGRVAKVIGGTVTLCWSMLLLSPFAIVVIVFSVKEMQWSLVAPTSWLGIAYLGIISMFLASVFWYRGLAIGGVGRIGQLNLLVPILAIGWSAALLGEQITVTEISCAFVVGLTMLVCLRSRAI